MTLTIAEQLRMITENVGKASIFFESFYRAAAGRRFLGHAIDDVMHVDLRE
jgi:hypothetical protein